MLQLFKRTLVYLVLGFAFSWILAWALIEIPRLMESRHILKAQTFIDDSEPTDPVHISVHEYRWIGLFERQYTAIRKVNFPDSRKPIKLWWSWSVIPEPFVNHSQAWGPIVDQFDPSEYPRKGAQFSIMRFGFPALAFEAQSAVNPAGALAGDSLPKAINGAYTTRVIDHTKYFKGRESSPMMEHVYFPYRPIWSGLLFNTVFFAIVIWMVRSVFRSIMHAKRMHKGLCPICKYQLGFVFIDGCSECGWRKTNQPTKS